MSALNPEQFDLRPNIKNKPGSQGTLFHVDASARTPESRYPRGYTPERMDEVQQRISVLPPTAQALDGLSEGSQKSIVSRHKRGVLETVARSTMSMEDAGTMYVAARPGGVMKGAAAHNRAVPSSRASETVMGGTMEASAGDSRKAKIVRELKGHPTWPNNERAFKTTQRHGAEDSTTLLHELGHHNSMVLQGNHTNYNPTATHGPHDLPYDPREEARADTHMMDHYRPDARLYNPKRRMHTAKGYEEDRHPDYVDERAKLGNAIGSRPKFSEIHGTDPKSLLETGLPPERIPGQTALLSKVAHTKGGFGTGADIHKWTQEESVDWDYNHEQHPRPDVAPRRETSTPMTESMFRERRAVKIQ